MLDGKRPIDIGDLKAYLRDHDEYPYSICRHEDLNQPPEDRYITVASAIMDLNERVLWISEGPPCNSEYQRVALP